MSNVKRLAIPFEDPRLGRHIAHDPRSWDHRQELPRTAEPLRSVQHRRYDPRPEPAQQIGCCTFVAECMMANAKGNRKKGEVLNMEDAENGYSLATSIDEFGGQYPPLDTGSSGLAAAKAAVQLGIASQYVWYFTVEDVLLALQDHVVSFGGYWYYSMFAADRYNPQVSVGGGIAGGHQWLLSGYRAREELIVGECWWGPEFGIDGRFYISVNDFRGLMADGGDAHYTYRKEATG
jgi:hypothetical protein